jgi:hypothetical protein
MRLTRLDQFIRMDDLANIMNCGTQVYGWLIDNQPWPRSSDLSREFAGDLMN